VQLGSASHVLKDDASRILSQRCCRKPEDPGAPAAFIIRYCFQSFTRKSYLGRLFSANEEGRPPAIPASPLLQLQPGAQYRYLCSLLGNSPIPLKLLFAGFEGVFMGSDDGKSKCSGFGLWE
jgi:hypothetical protein